MPVTTDFTDVAVANTLTVNGISVSGRSNVVNLSASGAIAIPAGNTSYHITKAGVAALTIADPVSGAPGTGDDGKRLTFISDTAFAHTLDNSAGSGFNGGGATVDVATFGGAKGDGMVIEAMGGKWYIVPGGSKNITLG